MVSVALGCLALSLTAAPSSALPGSVCYTVQRGDTAVRASLRLTGSAANLYAAWFQIVDPATLAIVPKSQYDHIQPGWQACIIQTVPRPTAVVIPRSDVRPAEPWVLAAVDAVGPWWPVLLLAATLLWGVVQAKTVRQQRAVRQALELFGRTFISELERPLTDRSSRGAPLRSALRVQPERKRIEILIAPAKGRRYPNLSDHRRNLEYDVDRVVRVLDARQFSCGHLESRGPWIVIPFQLHQPPTKEGFA
jgi:hypothetical protein